jgi:uncharacterized MAPEG superfamily protein
MQFWILMVLGLYFTQTLIPPTFRWVFGKSGPHLMEALGGRDNPPEISITGARLQRALANMNEAMVVFLPVALMLNARQPTPAVGISAAATFFFARLAYVPAYASGIPGLRSTLWCVGHGAIFVMVYVLAKV